MTARRQLREDSEQRGSDYDKRSGTTLGKCKPSQGSDREERLENCREQVSGWGARGPLGVTETLDCRGSNTLNVNIHRTAHQKG